MQRYTVELVHSHSSGRKRHWTALVSISSGQETLHPGEVQNIQSAEGYHPYGYGGPDDISQEVVEMLSGEVLVVTWTCANSCD